MQIIQLIVILVLIYIAIEDIFNFTIKNESVILLVILFFISAIFSGSAWVTVLHIVFGLIMFAVLLVLYELRVIGGGDTKFLSVAFLWNGSENTSLFCLLLAGTTATYYVLHRFGNILPGKPGPSGTTLIPYGPCIASAWIATMVWGIAA